MKDNKKNTPKFWNQSKEDEEFAATLSERTEELYQIPDHDYDDDGTFEAIVLELYDNIIFPRMVSPIFLDSDTQVNAINSAASKQQTVIGLALKDPDNGNPTLKDTMPVGVEMACGRVIDMPDGTNSALVQGRNRVQVLEFIKTGRVTRARVRLIDEPLLKDRKTKALMRSVLADFERVVQLNRTIPEEAHMFALNIADAGWLADMVATSINVSYEDRQKLLLEIDPYARLLMVSALLAAEIDVLQLEEDIHNKVQNEVDKSQREFYLREQLKAIQNELGEGDMFTRDINELREKVDKAKLPEEARKTALKEIERLGQMPPMAPEVGIIRTYIEWILDLPWNTFTQDNLAVPHAGKILERDHYGLQKAKDRILEYIAVRSLKPRKERQPILCFVGAPGTGKTSLGRSIAEALGRKFVRFSLGGVHDEAEIRGHRRTYIGALPGRILQTMKRAGSSNPLFMLDEIDKLGSDFRGDPSSALLEVLDPEQNNTFSDHYLEIPFDLSKVMFITTANSLGTIPEALLDRLEVLEFPGYIEEEKTAISTKYLIPRQLEENGMHDAPVKFQTAAIQRVIREYTYEAGVRNLERELGTIIRKVARMRAEGKETPKHVTPDLVEKFLGPPQFLRSEAELKDDVGVATSLAWTENGGEIMSIEVAVLEGKGTLQMTGQIGDVMQESGQAALTFIKSRCDQFELEPDLFERLDIHVHIPEGAIPKDGPSAGITLACAILSALTGRPLYRLVGMTGEITLRGRVLPIGGVREKLLAAHRAGLKTVIIPAKNTKDLVDVPEKARAELEIIPVEHMDQVLARALYPQPVVAPLRPRKRAEEVIEE